MDGIVNRKNRAEFEAATGKEDAPLGDLKIQLRVLNKLEEAGIETVAELVSCCPLRSEDCKRYCACYSSGGRPQDRPYRYLGDVETIAEKTIRDINQAIRQWLREESMQWRNAVLKCEDIEEMINILPAEAHEKAPQYFPNLQATIASIRTTIADSMRVTKAQESMIMNSYSIVADWLPDEDD